MSGETDAVREVSAALAARESARWRALEWPSNEHAGLSSMCIWRTMLGVPEPESWAGSYPYDPADFMRCRRLLKLMPEWRARLPEMAKHGKVWAALAERWDEIEASFVREVGDEPRRNAMAPETYALMRAIREPIEDAEYEAARSKCTTRHSHDS